MLPVRYPMHLENFMEDNGSSERFTFCMQGLLGMEWPEEGAS